jgi:hypothetical protein
LTAPDILEQPPTRRRKAIGVVLGGLLVGLVLAYLTASGLWPVSLVLILAYPAFLLLHRRPLVVIPIWLLTGPLIAVTQSPAVRALFWVAHRGLPLAALIAVVVSRIVGDRDKAFPRLGLPELMMGGYVVVTTLSVLYRSLEPFVTGILMYDRIVIPMLLYLVIRLVEPGPSELRGLVPVFAFILLFETLVGALSWVAPGVLPSYWLNHQGLRTVGSLSEVNLYGTTVLTAGLFLFYGSMASRRGGRFLLGIGLFGLSLFMAFFTFSRASWLAALAVMLGLLLLRPKQVGKFLLVGLTALVLLVGSGALDQQLEFADQRLLSEQSANSALSRLPVVVASVRMFNERPIIGWGYENFDRYDYQFQGPFANLIFPDRDHASHNLWLTILSEQGLVGFILYVGPALYWLVLTKRNYAKLPTEGYLGRNLVVVAWLAILSHVIVNNFTRMQLPFGFGLYWIMLGLIASTVYRFSGNGASDEVTRLPASA